MHKNSAGCFGCTNRFVLNSITTISLVLTLFCHEQARAADTQLIVGDNNGYSIYNARTGQPLSFTGYGYESSGGVAFFSRHQFYGSLFGVVGLLKGSTETSWTQNPYVNYPAGEVRFQNPKGIVVGPDNGIYIAFQNGHNVWRFSSSMNKSHSIYVTNTPAHQFPSSLNFHPGDQTSLRQLSGRFRARHLEI